MEQRYLIIALAIVLTIAIYNLLRILYNKLDADRLEIQGSYSEKRRVTFKTLKELTNKTDDKFIKYKYMFIQAGNPTLLVKIGMNSKNFQRYRLIVAVAILTLYISNISEGILYVLIWYIILSYFLKGKKKKRHNEIKIHLSKLIENTIDYLKNGLSISEIISTVKNDLPKGPLLDEIKILNITIQSNATDLRTAINETKKRIGMEEIDNYANALLTFEATGRAVDLLKKQLEMAKIVRLNAIMRQTKGRSNYVSIAVVTIIVGIALVALIPFVVSIMNNPFLGV